jgi:fatty acid-binding protein DegV
MMQPFLFTFQAAVAAGSMVDGIKFYPFDSEMSCMVQGFYARGSRLGNQGRPTGTHYYKPAGGFKKFTRAYFMVDDLSHLQKGGRLSSAQAFIGSLLQVNRSFIF